MKNIIKEALKDYKSCVVEEGIFIPTLGLLLSLLLLIVSLPFLLLYLLNEWSKSWFNK